MKLSLRARTLGAVAVLTVLGLGVSDTVTVLALRSFLVDRTDQQLNSLEPQLRAFADNRIEVAEGHGFFGPGQGDPTPYLSSTLPSGGFIEVVNRDGTALLRFSQARAGQAVTTPRLPDSLPGLTVEPGVAFTQPAQEAGAAEYRMHAWGLRSGGVLILGQSLQVVNDTVAQLASIAAVVSGLVLLGVLSLGWWLVRTGLRPLERISSTADAIAGGDLSLRAPDADPHTEVGRLATAFNAMLSQIEQAFAEQRASEARLRRFIADASHELRTPLTSVRGYAELFRRGAGRRPEDLAKAMRRIEDEAARMGLLVDDMLLLARLDQGRPLDREPVDLSVVATEAVDAAHAVEPERPLALEAAQPVIVEGDRARLRQVVDNLLANVRVHTPAGAPARVAVLAEDGMAVLKVSDRGPGIPADAVPHLFERFFRIDQGRSRHQGGSGLGLSIVNAITNAHGGAAEVGSRPGEGATFTIRIPIRSAPPLPDPEPTDPPA